MTDQPRRYADSDWRLLRQLIEREIGMWSGSGAFTDGMREGLNAALTYMDGFDKAPAAEAASGDSGGDQ